MFVIMKALECKVITFKLIVIQKDVDRVVKETREATFSTPPS